MGLQTGRGSDLDTQTLFQTATEIQTQSGGYEEGEAGDRSLWGQAGSCSPHSIKGEEGGFGARQWEIGQRDNCLLAEGYSY